VWGFIDATVKLIRRLGGEVHDAAFIINLFDLGGEQRLEKLGINCFAGRQQVINDQHFIAFFDGINVDFQLIGAIFKLIAAWAAKFTMPLLLSICSIWAANSAWKNWASIALAWCLSRAKQRFVGAIYGLRPDNSWAGSETLEGEFTRG
jgi:hypothetical protein